FGAHRSPSYFLHLLGGVPLNRMTKFPNHRPLMGGLESPESLRYAQRSLPTKMRNSPTTDHLVLGGISTRKKFVDGRGRCLLREFGHLWANNRQEVFKCRLDVLVTVEA